MTPKKSKAPQVERLRRLMGAGGGDPRRLDEEARYLDISLLEEHKRERRKALVDAA